MKLRKNSGKILWGLFFILAAVYVVVSKLWIMPEVSVFSILLTVFFIWLFLNGIRNVNFWEILFSIAFICIIYDDWLGITALTPWTVLGAALLGSIGLSLIFKKRVDTNLPFLLSMTVTATTRMRSTLVKISKSITILVQPSNT